MQKLFVFSALAWSMASTACGQFKESKTDGDEVRLGAESTSRVKIGVVVTAKGGPCKGLFATAAVPTEWPEQRVKIVEEDVSPTVKSVEYRSLARTVKQMLIEVPYLGPGQEARGLITFEVTRNEILPPKDTSKYKIPEKPSRDLLIYLGPSPYIESRHPKIIALAKQLAADKENAWEHVEAIYDWTREHVEYKNGELKGAIRALIDKTGDCEELTSLFIAICRASKIPARTVWVPGHCYPEFYLEDAQGNGHWFPCQAAGARAFGGIQEQRPILQKGDNFKDPDRPHDHLRYVSEFLKGSAIKGAGRPSWKTYCDPVGSG